MWGNVAVTQAFLTLSEVVGHVDLLIDAGLVSEVEGEDGVVRFEATGVDGAVTLPGDEIAPMSNRLPTGVRMQMSTATVTSPPRIEAVPIRRGCLRAPPRSGC